MYKLTIILPDGTEKSFVRKTKPRHYASWLMQQLPYGTKVQGARFKCEKVSK